MHATLFNKRVLRAVLTHLDPIAEIVSQMCSAILNYFGVSTNPIMESSKINLPD